MFILAPWKSLIIINSEGWTGKEIIRETGPPRSERSPGGATEMMQSAVMQTNTPDAVRPGLIAGCGCLPCKVSREAAARSVHYSPHLVINEVWNLVTIH